LNIDGLQSGAAIPACRVVVRLYDGASNLVVTMTSLVTAPMASTAFEGDQYPGIRAAADSISPCGTGRRRCARQRRGAGLGRTAPFFCRRQRTTALDAVLVEMCRIALTKTSDAGSA
jgi:hypothetical protein